jgi:hypothetical protein
VSDTTLAIRVARNLSIIMVYLGKKVPQECIIKAGAEASSQNPGFSKRFGTLGGPCSTGPLNSGYLAVHAGVFD